MAGKETIYVRGHMRGNIYIDVVLIPPDKEIDHIPTGWKPYKGARAYEWLERHRESDIFDTPEQAGFTYKS